MKGIAFMKRTLQIILLSLTVSVISCSGDGEYDPSLKEDPILKSHQMENGKVLFSFRNLFGPVYQVQVDGDFAHDGKPAGPFLLKDLNGDGVYRGTAELDAGLYMYRFLINGNILVDPAGIHDYPFAGESGSILVRNDAHPGIAATRPPNHSIISNQKELYFRIGGNTGAFSSGTLTVYINGKEKKPQYDSSSGRGKIAIPAGFGSSVTFSFRAQTTDGMEVLNDTITLYAQPASPVQVLKAGITGYRVLFPWFGKKNMAGKATLRALISRLDYLNNGKEDGTSLGIRLLILHALYPTADRHCRAALSYSGFRRGVYRTLLNTLSRECRKRGIKLIMHYNTGFSSNRHHWFQEAYGNLASRRKRWFRFLDSRHTRYAGFMGLKAFPILSIGENDMAQAWFLNNIWDWIKSGLDGFYLENASLQHDRLWTGKINPSIFRYKKTFILARAARREPGRIAYLSSGPANLVSFRQFPGYLQLALRTGEIRNLPALLAPYRENTPGGVFLKPTSIAGHKRPGSVFRKNSSRAAYLGNALTGSGIPVIRYGDELGSISPKYPEGQEPAVMPWGNFERQKKMPVSLFNLCRTLIRLRSAHPELRHDRIANKPVVFYDAEWDEPLTASVRTMNRKSFFLLVSNPEGVNTKFSREIKVPGVPDGNYSGINLLQPTHAKLTAEAEDGNINFSDCPTEGLGFLIYRFTKK